MSAEFRPETLGLKFTPDRQSKHILNVIPVISSIAYRTKQDDVDNILNQGTQRKIIRSVCQNCPVFNECEPDVIEKLTIEFDPEDGNTQSTKIQVVGAKVNTPNCNLNNNFISSISAEVADEDQ